eukprot:5786362-Amphidinium_carterae.2
MPSKPVGLVNCALVTHAYQTLMQPHIPVTCESDNMVTCSGSWMNKLSDTLAYAASCHVKLLMPPCCNYAAGLSGFSLDAASLSRCKQR